MSSRASLKNCVNVFGAAIVLMSSGWASHAASAQAQTQITLPEINASTEKSLPVDTTEPNIPCADIITRLEKYSSMARQHDLSVSTFLGEVTGKLLGWYDQLQPLEGTQQELPVGVFSPLQDGANKITAVTDIAYENTALLANEMDRLINSLKQCTLTGMPLKP